MSLNDIITESPQIIYQDDDLVVVHKPSQFYVHPPECKIARKAVKRKTLIHWLTDYHQLYANPIHRLDYATEGLVLFGLNSRASSELNKMMRAHAFHKEYEAIVRGWFKEEHGKIDLPLELDSTNELVPALTYYETLKKIELPFQVNSRFNSTRYSWLKLKLETGRWHQIRRHMNRVAHPIIGDREHGDSHHNRFFRDQLNISGLCLKAVRLKFTHPFKNEIIDLNAPETSQWTQIKEIFLN